MSIYQYRTADIEATVTDDEVWVWFKITPTKVVQMTPSQWRALKDIVGQDNNRETISKESSGKESPTSGVAAYRIMSRW